ncbi:MAG: SDR family NAD(P)-dependent oxidoreductase, partial [Treponema sp.]|nr:SDR family NAD(P)-dependent oxidoreductase [Treponema sp.]
YAETVDKSKNLDEIWLIARREDRLRGIAEKLTHTAKIFPLDLTKSVSIDRFKAALEERAKISPYEELVRTENSGSTPYTAEVTLFINCAGFGKIGNYKTVLQEDSDNMIELNCRAAVDLTLAVLPYMRSGGRIIQAASASAFQPVQQLAVYAATKAFLVSWSRALRWELLPRGIHVTAVCPYWMRGTEFIGKAEKNGGEISHAVRNFLFGDIPVVVVYVSLLASALNLPVVTPGIMSLLHRIAAKFIPHEIMQAGWEGWRRI